MALSQFEKELNKYRTFRDWLEKEHAESLKDISEHGADSGYHGMIYNVDINAILNRWESEIEGIVEEIGTIGEGYQHYCDRRKDSFSLQGLKCWLVWSAAELIAHEIAGDR